MVLDPACTETGKGGTHRRREENGGFQGLDGGEMGRCWSEGSKVQFYKMKKLLGSDVQHGDCSSQFCLVDWENLLIRSTV
jgi:hypothetical protein